MISRLSCRKDAAEMLSGCEPVESNVRRTTFLPDHGRMSVTIAVWYQTLRKKYLAFQSVDMAQEIYALQNRRVMRYASALRGLGREVLSKGKQLLVFGLHRRQWHSFGNGIGCTGVEDDDFSPEKPEFAYVVDC